MKVITILVSCVVTLVVASMSEALTLSLSDDFESYTPSGPPFENTWVPVAPWAQLGGNPTLDISPQHNGPTDLLLYGATRSCGEADTD